MMNERIARRRRLARRVSRGFTLIELMVVVILVAVLAMLATPSLQVARNDRIAFDYARQYQQVLVQGRARAAGTGSAHLTLLTGGTGGRGVIRLYAALDGTSTAGPNPVSSCKLNPTQWDTAQAEIADYRIDQNLTGNFVRFVSYAELNRAGVNVDMDLKAALTAANGTDAMATTSAVAICITPAGITYAGWGNTAADAITAMRDSTPFTGVIEAAIQRHTNGAGVGLKRRVIVSGGGAPRLRSE